MGIAVNGELAVHLDVRGSVQVNLPFHPSRHEDYFRITPGLENFPVHSMIAQAVATFATRSVDHNLAIGLAAYGIEVNHAALERKGSVNGMEGRVERPFNVRLRRIELQRCVLSERRATEAESDEE